MGRICRSSWHLLSNVHASKFLNTKESRTLIDSCTKTELFRKCSFRGRSFISGFYHRLCGFRLIVRYLMKSPRTEIRTSMTYMSDMAAGGWFSHGYASILNFVNIVYFLNLQHSSALECRYLKFPREVVYNRSGVALRTTFAVHLRCVDRSASRLSVRLFDNIKNL